MSSALHQLLLEQQATLPPEMRDKQAFLSSRSDRTGKEKPKRVPDVVSAPSEPVKETVQDPVEESSVLPSDAKPSFVPGMLTARPSGDNYGGASTAVPTVRVTYPENSLVVPPSRRTETVGRSNVDTNFTFEPMWGVAASSNQGFLVYASNRCLTALAVLLLDEDRQDVALCVFFAMAMRYHPSAVSPFLVMDNLPDSFEERYGIGVSAVLEAIKTLELPRETFLYPG